MKSKQVLSIEQMKHLQELSLNTSDASMCFEWKGADKNNMVVSFLDADTNYDCCHPTYALQDILDKQPCFIGTHVLTLQKLENSYTCLYMEPYSRSILNLTESKELIDASYYMLCWCIENGYVKVGKEEQL